MTTMRRRRPRLEECNLRFAARWAALLLASTAALGAATFTVTNTNDTGGG